MSDRWRPQCYVCSRFVAMEAYDVWWDDYYGAWEEGYTACPAHGGPSPERIIEMKREKLEYERRCMESLV